MPFLSFKTTKTRNVQIGKSIKKVLDSVPTNIVEGYERKRYKADLIKFLAYS
ncbi:four helix bundle protein [Flavobacterium psychrophilum]|uniref:four helix bundle protein n=1 Tax=Flavobacterium psychrophilum TaxID=96345 RepID=UPI0038F799B6